MAGKSQTALDISKILVFGKWSVEGIEVLDPGLKRYLDLRPKFVPKSNWDVTKQRFHKAKVFIVERLITKLMVTGHRGKKHKVTSGHHTGKTQTLYKHVKACFEIIESKTGKNPIEVFVRAIENAAPREEVVSIEYGGARYPKAVDVAPLRRIDLALRYMTQGAYSKCFKSKKSLAEALADEILNAYNNNPASFAIARKLELERQADASR